MTVWSMGDNSLYSQTMLTCKESTLSNVTGKLFNLIGLSHKKKVSQAAQSAKDIWDPHWPHMVFYLGPIWAPIWD